ncbi:MAG: STAS domain-containing protein [Legionellaceae bacterium]|nr:STAS domain-containing protein [Legionellaceae bacterium]
MSDELLSYGVVSYVSQNILIVPFQADFYDEIIRLLRNDVLNKVHESPELNGLILDLSNIKLIDSSNMKTLENTLDMASLLGVTTCLTGIQPQVALILAELGYDPSGINTSLSIECGIKKIHQFLEINTINDQDLFEEISEEDEVDVFETQESNDD